MGGMTIDEAFHELIPVLGVVRLMDPGVEGDVVIDLDFWDFSKLKTEIVLQYGPCYEGRVVR